MTGLAILAMLTSLATQPAGASDPTAHVRVAVDVGFTDREWKLAFDNRGWVKGDVGGNAFSSTSLPASTVTRIRDLARCVVALPEPVFPGPPIMDTADGMRPVTILEVHVGAVRRRIFVAQDTFEGPGVADAWPAIHLLIELRGLVGDPSAYDYRPWLRRGLSRPDEPRCPWLAEE